MCELFGVHDKIYFVHLQEPFHEIEIDTLPTLPSYRDVTTRVLFPSIPHEMNWFCPNVKDNGVSTIFKAPASARPPLPTVLLWHTTAVAGAIKAYSPQTS